jgi:hypothetical protein
VVAVYERINAGFGAIVGLPQPLNLSSPFQSSGKEKVYSLALGAKAAMSGITDVGAQGHM